MGGGQIFAGGGKVGFRFCILIQGFFQRAGSIGRLIAGPIDFSKRNPNPGDQIGGGSILVVNDLAKLLTSFLAFSAAVGDFGRPISGFRLDGGRGILWKRGEFLVGLFEPPLCEKGFGEQ